MSEAAAHRCTRHGCSRVLVRGWCSAHGDAAPAIPEAVAAELAAERAPRAAYDRWTPAEITFALEARGRLNAREIAQALGRTRRGVKNWFGRAGIPLPPVAGRKRKAPAKRIAAKARGHWSASEVAELEDGETKLLTRGRSWAAIKKKAWHIGQPVRSGDGAMSPRQVAARWHVNHEVMRLWVSRGLLPATRSGKMWRIDPDVAERLVPEIKRFARAANGRRGWWQAAEFRAWLERERAEINERERNIDRLVQK